MSLDFSHERLADCIEECKPLFEAHWQETEMYRAGTAFNPDYEKYLQYNEIGFYQFFVARRDGKIVGDAGMYDTKGMHDQRKLAVEDTWYIVPEARQGMGAIRFLQFVEQDLRAQGVQDVYMTTKLANGAGRILEFCGYSHVANQFWKNLECAHHQLPRRPTIKV